MKDSIATLVGARTFRLRAAANLVIKELEKDPQSAQRLVDVEGALGKKVSDYVLESLVRNTLFIEPDLDGDGTKYDSRWGARLAAGDPRRADIANCLELLRDLLESLVAGIGDVGHREVLVAIEDRHVIPYELPVDIVDPSVQPLHAKGNLGWIWNQPEIMSGVALRKAMRDPGIVGDGPANEVGLILTSKIKVKTYLTDRSQTGAFKTNREKRWEAHPKSPQFASRLDCLRIERKLLAQLAGMVGFPEAARVTLAARGLVEADAATLCPITLDPLNYEELVAEVSDPVHGKSLFQVGHLNPLKSLAGDQDHHRHTADNVSWISQDGNRIQGHYTLDETRELLGRVAANYAGLGG